MKTHQFVILISVLVLGIALLAYAQTPTYGAIAFGTIAPTVSNCPSGSANNATLCAVGSSPSTYTMYVSYNAGAYQLLVPPPSSAPVGVTSFGNPPRTGAVVLTEADVAATGAKVTVPAQTATIQ